MDTEFVASVDRVKTTLSTHSFVRGDSLSEFITNALHHGGMTAAQSRRSTSFSSPVIAVVISLYTLYSRILQKYPSMRVVARVFGLVLL